jgi:hypothetical protein
MPIHRDTGQMVRRGQATRVFEVGRPPSAPDRPDHLLSRGPHRGLENPLGANLFLPQVGFHNLPNLG